ncbi:MAG: ABC transporter permease, partial [Dehalococcoidia bacterium]|nr:ABC transporter permease [Dehalococcoidia bacterium]
FREEGGFNRPVWEQFGQFAARAVVGDFGLSIWQNRPATQVVIERLPATFQLAFAALIFTVVVSIPIAIIAARNVGTTVETAITTIATAMGSVATFWLALVLILIFSVGLRLLPSSGYGSWQQFILPVVALSVQPIGRLIQVLQTQIAAELKQGYVTTAIAKGLSQRAVMYRHVLRNSAIAAVTVIGGEMVVFLSVAVLVESIFAWPGVGQVTLQAIQRRDLPVVMASVFYTGLMVTVINLLVELAYGWLDPRIRAS